MPLPDFTPGQILTAADLEAAFAGLFDPGLDAWAAYVPTWGGTVGNGTLAGAYFKVGRFVKFRIHLIFGSTTVGPAGAWQFGVPFPAAVGVYPVGNARLVDTSAGLQFGKHLFCNTANVVAIVGDAANSYVQNTVPFTWANTDQLMMAGSYESQT